MKVAILGYGKSGQTAKRLLEIKGVQAIEIFDDKMDGFEGIKDFNYAEFDTVVVSPGIDLTNLEIPIERITSELEIAFEFIKDRKIIGITGTNGKSTVTFLTSQILKNIGVNAEFCGNIGVTVGDTYLSKNPDVYVVEVSSFQLDLLKKFRFDTSAITNITPDHLDRYKSMDRYILSKSRIVEFTEGVSFLEKGDWNGIFMKYESVKYVDGKLKNYPLLNGNLLKFEDFHVDIDRYKLFGFHNIVNLSFALLLTDQIFRLKGDVTKLVENLTPLEHRCEFVTEINGVRYINDSKGTNVDSTLTALKSSSYPTTLILGGKDKDGDFTALADEINRKAKLVICCGAAGEKIYNALKDIIKVEIVRVDLLKDAISLAYRETKEGTVLFSPACASFDEFNNFEERGRFFKNYVNNLKVNGC
ncbi:Mur ligase family protein [Calditerrivibrio sp.]|jgi:UDP-N-acetylmuramoylalanine--D-glutamate ligase|uniref:UDP-N-acetylmuramoylalanine--D-glutamate ligase n=1 Tax=Calditerrivibrio nitroreducens TaxID=477976 RepID=A0A2J6WHA9_9BACT|nr:MAG: UDP-N-acetylmuramoyl-L-alanine--D-glutamate ligase [Calditerrivibrio nitroreducens]